MRRAYLALAVLGAALPYAFFVGFLHNGWTGPSSLLMVPFQNGLVGGFTADLLISSAVFWLFMWLRWRESQGPNPTLFLALNLLIGLSCAMPAYLYVCESSRWSGGLSSGQGR